MTKALLTALAAALASTSAAATINLQYSYAIEGLNIYTGPPSYSSQPNGVARETVTLSFNGLDDGFTSATLGDPVTGLYTLSRSNGLITLNFRQLSPYSTVYTISAAETAQDTFGTGQTFSYTSNVAATKYGTPSYAAYSRIGTAITTTVSPTAFAGPAITTLEQVLPLPEPETWAMMLAGFGLIGAAMRRRPATAQLV